jgi:hypothetical protein
VGSSGEAERLGQALQGSTYWQEARSWLWCRSKPYGKSLTAASALLAGGMRCLNTPTLADRCTLMLIIIAALVGEMTMGFSATVLNVAGMLG